MDINRCLILNELIDAYKSRDDSNTRKVLEEISSNRELQLSDTERLLVHYLSYVSSSSHKPLEATACALLASIEGISKVSISYIKRKSTSTPYSMLWTWLESFSADLKYLPSNQSNTDCSVMIKKRRPQKRAKLALSIAVGGRVIKGILFKFSLDFRIRR